MIVETEAYAGINDKASHAYNNKKTNRTKIMYKKGGICYVYLCYGMHYLINIVTGEKNFPHRKQQSNIDIGLLKGAGDDEYLTTLDEALTLVLRQFQPDAIIYDAGVDIHVNDDLGLLNVTTEGVLTRDKRVFDFADGCGVPIAAVIGGGYQRDIAALVDVHLQLYKAAGVIAR